MNDAWVERQKRPQWESELKKQTKIGGGRKKREEGAKNGWDDKGTARLGAERSKRWASRRAGGWADGPAMAALPSHP